MKTGLLRGLLGPTSPCLGQQQAGGSFPAWWMKSGFPPARPHLYILSSVSLP